MEADKTRQCSCSPSFYYFNKNKIISIIKKGEESTLFSIKTSTPFTQARKSEKDKFYLQLSFIGFDAIHEPNQTQVKKKKCFYFTYIYYNIYICCKYN